MPEEELASSNIPVRAPEETATSRADEGRVEGRERSDPADWVDLYGDYNYYGVVKNSTDFTSGKELDGK